MDNNKKAPENEGEKKESIFPIHFFGSKDMTKSVGIINPRYVEGWEFEDYVKAYPDLTIFQHDPPNIEGNHQEA